MSEDTKADPTSRVGIERSPNYPSATLTQAIELVAKLYAMEKRTVVSPDAAVKALGYSALSGTARTMLASLRAYGLTETAKDGVRVSDLAMDIIHHPIGSVERTKALKEAAKRPPIIVELFDSHADASDDSLRAYLITKRKFSPEATGRFIPAFREAIQIARLPDIGGGEAKSSGAKEFAYPPPQKEQLQWSANRPVVPPLSPDTGGTMQFVWQLSGDVVATMSVSKQIEEDDVEVLTANLEAAKKAILKQAKSNATKVLTAKPEAPGGS